MRNKALVGTWLVSNTYVDQETKFLLTQTDRQYGTLSNAIENSIHNLNTQDLRFQFYSPNDETSN